FGYMSHTRGVAHYEDAALRIWRHGEPAGGDAAALRELVRYATLAPSSHNTQCWKFRLGERRVSILPDHGRRCPVVDPDDHHLFVSLGCAAENLVHAGLAMGLRAEPVFVSGADEALHIALEPAAAQRTPLFEAIPRRQSTRAEFDARPLALDALKLLEAAGTGTGVRVLLFTDSRAMEEVLGFVIEGNSAQMRDPAFVRELKHWIRFNAGEAASSGDGLFSGASGNPSLPGWLGRLLFDAVFSEQAENDKYARH